MKGFEDVSPTFCALPWIHLASNPNGTTKMCCIANEDLTGADGKTLSFEHDSIEKIWNSPQMLEARRKMLRGEKVSACSQCYNEEALGAHSMRIGFNDKWFLQEKNAVYARIEESQKNSFNLNSMPWYYDLRQGNLCNLKCRSCAAENSVAIEKEYIKIAEKDQWFARTFYRPDLPESYRSWFKSDFFNSQLTEQLPNVKKLYFTGGEPTLIESNFKLLEHCIERGYAKSIELMFNTNLTNLSDRFLNIISEFRFVMLNLSIDGFGAEQEYLRGNSKWNLIAENLEKLALRATPNVQPVINPVIQACNVLTIVNLFKFIEELNAKHGRNIFNFMPIILTDPKHLELSILPKPVRQLSAERLERYLKSSKITPYDRFFEPRLLQVISKLQEDVEPNAELTETFINFTAVLDKSRNQSFQSVFPELFELWKRHDKDFIW